MTKQKMKEGVLIYTTYLHNSYIREMAFILSFTVLLCDENFLGGCDEVK